jgi:hypothetical protein
MVDGRVRDGALLLQGRGGNMRRWFGHLADDEKHDEEELTVDGGWLSESPMMSPRGGG